MTFQFGFISNQMYFHFRLHFSFSFHFLDTYNEQSSLCIHVRPNKVYTSKHFVAKKADWRNGLGW